MPAADADDFARITPFHMSKKASVWFSLLMRYGMPKRGSVAELAMHLVSGGS